MSTWQEIESSPFFDRLTPFEQKFYTEMKDATRFIGKQDQIRQQILNKAERWAQDDKRASAKASHQQILNCDRCGKDLYRFEAKATGGPPISDDGTVVYFTTETEYDPRRYLCVSCWCESCPDMYGYRTEEVRRQKSGWYRNRFGLWEQYV